MTNGVLICGLGRCGSSLACQMFDAGGADVVGEFPSFEHDNCAPDPKFKPAWVIDQLSAGRVVKLLDPHLNRLPEFDACVIWIDRNAKQQAASTIKFGVHIGAAGGVKNKHFGGMRKVLERDRLRALNYLKSVSKTRVHKFRFEEILRDPKRNAEHLAQCAGMELDIDRMAETVVARKPECLPYMLEIEQLAGLANAAGKRGG